VLSELDEVFKLVVCASVDSDDSLVVSPSVELLLDLLLSLLELEVSSASVELDSLDSEELLEVV